MNVSIIGCGHGGQSLAADLTLRGCNVTLYAHPKHPGGLNAVAHQKGLQCKGLINEFVPIYKTTCDLQTAAESSKYLLISLPSYAHESIFIELLPFIKPKQVIVTFAANFASLVYLSLLEKIHQTFNLTLIDVASLPYVCRSDNQGTVEILAVKKRLAIAGIPASISEIHMSALNKMLSSELMPYTDVVSLGMNTTNGIVHPALALLNAGRIGADKEAFYFYRDGITPEIATLVQKLDNERMLIGEKLGASMYSFLDLNAQYYEQHHKSIYDFFRESPMHNALTMCPTSLQARYISEDVAGALVAWHSLGSLVGVETPALKSLIQLAGLLNSTNYFRTGRNLVRLGLHDKNMSEIQTYVRSGSLFCLEHA